jgi:hypothetical protein
MGTHLIDVVFCTLISNQRDMITTKLRQESAAQKEKPYNQESERERV